MFHPRRRAASCERNPGPTQVRKKEKGPIERERIQEHSCLTACLTIVLCQNDRHADLKQVLLASLAEVAACGPFRAADDGFTALHACVLGPGPMLRHTVNAAFAERFHGAEALVEKAIHHRLAPCLLMTP